MGKEYLRPQSVEMFGVVFTPKKEDEITYYLPNQNLDGNALRDAGLYIDLIPSIVQRLNDLDKQRTLLMPHQHIVFCPPDMY